MFALRAHLKLSTSESKYLPLTKCHHLCNETAKPFVCYWCFQQKFVSECYLCSFCIGYFIIFSVYLLHLQNFQIWGKREKSKKFWDDRCKNFSFWVIQKISLGGELIGWSHPEGSAQRLDVQMHTADERCPSEVCIWTSLMFNVFIKIT